MALTQGTTNDPRIRHPRQQEEPTYANRHGETRRILSQTSTPGETAPKDSHQRLARIVTPRIPTIYRSPQTCRMLQPHSVNKGIKAHDHTTDRGVNMGLAVSLCVHEHTSSTDYPTPLAVGPPAWAVPAAAFRPATILPQALPSTPH